MPQLSGSSRSPPWQEQQLLELRLNSEASFDTWHVAANQRHILQALRRVIDERQAGSLFLYGPPGSGRSHLLQAVVHQSRAAQLRGQYLPLRKIKPHHLEEVLDAQHGLHLLCLDDVEQLLGVHHHEQLLFHLFNRLRSQGAWLVLSAPTAPRQLNCGLPDLRTRLAGAITHRLDPIPDEDKKQALLLHARHRGLDLPQKVTDYLLSQHQRDMPSLMHLLDQLEHQAVRAQRDITRPFVSGLLKNSG